MEVAAPTAFPSVFHMSHGELLESTKNVGSIWPIDVSDIRGAPTSLYGPATPPVDDTATPTHSMPLELAVAAKNSSHVPAHARSSGAQ